MNESKTTSEIFQKNLYSKYYQPKQNPETLRDYKLVRKMVSNENENAIKFIRTLKPHYNKTIFEQNET